MPANFSELPLTQQHDLLREAFTDWVSGQYPEARMLGDVVEAQRTAAQIKAAGAISLSDYHNSSDPFYRDGF